MRGCRADFRHHEAQLDSPEGQETTNDREDENRGVELVNLKLSPPPAQILGGIS